MFRQIAAAGLKTGALNKAENLFEYHPLQLATALELAWSEKFSASPNPQLSTPLPVALRGLLSGGVVASRAFITPLSQLNWDHLIYAYLIENTRIYEIFRRVLYEYMHGERLDIPSAAGRQWVRNTEQLFYRDPPPFLISSLTSHIRPDLRASRRNAYYRMFGLDLNHGTDDGRPYLYEKPAAANRDFVTTFEKLLFEIWRGIVNVNTFAGPNPTDDAAMVDRARQLFEMLTTRRRNGNLSEDEFYHVATMSWFHMTVESNSPIVQDLKAEAESPAERLQKIGERVGLPAHGKAEDLFSLAGPMSTLLISIEQGNHNTIPGVQAFYRPATGNNLRDNITTIITNWSSATGRNVKGEPVTVSAGAVPSAAVSPNGSARVPVPRT